MEQKKKKSSKDNKIIHKKRYYRIEFCLASAMSVGSGKDVMTDKDIIRDSSGEPYIPGTTLAGIYRTLFKDPDQYFGSLQQGDTSRIITYDAYIIGGKPKISNRDCVGLDKYKTGIPSAKFDFEILEPGAKFVTYLEQDRYGPKSSEKQEEKNKPELLTAEEDDRFADVIAAAWMENRIVIGAKSARGLGQVTDVKIYEKEFDFNQPADIDRWIGFDLYDAGSWEKEWKQEKVSIQGKEDKKILLSISLDQKSPLTIRTYTADIGETALDYKQMAYIRNGTEIPVIPGTSWAGAFRHHMEKLGTHPDALQQLFGCKAKHNQEHGETGRKSAIVFSESEIRHAKSKIVTRNAIDRFSGGAVERALFTEKSCVGGSTLLKIQVNGNGAGKECMKALAASVVDLDMGLLAIGGETSVGHGLFAITELKVNDSQNLKTEKPEETFQKLADALTEGD